MNKDFSHLTSESKWKDVKYRTETLITPIKKAISEYLQLQLPHLNERFYWEKFPLSYHLEPITTMESIRQKLVEYKKKRDLQIYNAGISLAMSKHQRSDKAKIKILPHELLRTIRNYSISRLPILQILREKKKFKDFDE